MQSTIPSRLKLLEWDMTLKIWVPARTAISMANKTPHLYSSKMAIWVLFHHAQGRILNPVFEEFMSIECSNGY